MYRRIYSLEFRVHVPNVCVWNSGTCNCSTGFGEAYMTIVRLDPLEGFGVFRV